MSKNIEIKVDNDFTPLPDDAPAKVVEAGNFTEVTTMKHQPNMKGLQNRVRLSKDEYVCTDTGEVKKYSEMLDRADNPHLQETLKKIRLYIHTNFYAGGQFLTLCYDGAMTDFDRAKDDLNSFLRELRKTYEDLEYFWVVEPKESGSWHFHMLTKEKEITAEKLQELWTHGCIDVQDIFDIKGLAYYLSPCYRKDVEAGEEKEVNEIDGIGVLSKAKQKAERLKFYPSGVRIYGKSNGIEKWKEIKTTRGEAETLVQGKKKMGEITIRISEAETGKEVNVINKEIFGM